MRKEYPKLDQKIKKCSARQIQPIFCNGITVRGFGGAHNEKPKTLQIKYK